MRKSFIVFIMLILSSAVILAQDEGDVNQDGKVDIEDVLLVSQNIGRSDFDGGTDINSDGEVNVFDLVLTAKHFGKQYDGTAETISLPEGLVAAYPLDSSQTAEDVSGNGNDGSVNGAVVSPGKYGDGLLFSDGDEVQVPDSPVLDFSNGYTFTAWVRFDSVGGSGTLKGLISKGGKSFGIMQSSAGGDVVGDKVRLNLIHDGFDHHTGWVFPYQKLFHLAVTWDGSTTKFYVDGEESASLGVEDIPNTGTDPATIGWGINSNSWTGGMVGLIDDLHLYNRPLSSSEIASVMNTGLNGSVESECSPSPEICDGLDNDCDGEIDEDCDECVDGESKQCGTDIGACTYGTQSCINGTWGECTGGITPSTEACDDDIDNDCDGSIDEGCADGEWNNAPSDHTVLTDRSFDSVDEDGWNDFEDGRFSIESDSVAGGSPFSPGSMGQFYYPMSDTSATPAGGITNYNLPEDTKEVYLGWWMKVKEDWDDHSCGIASPKLFFLRDGDTTPGGDPLVVTRRSSGAVRATLQSQYVQNREMEENVGSANVAPGSWHKVEAVAKANTDPSGDNPDGELHIWVDDVKTLEYTDVYWMNSEGLDWEQVSFQPLWGCQGDTLKNDNYWWIDHAYITAKTNQEYPNEPSGFTKLAETSFTAKGEDGWDNSGEGAAGRYNIIDDITAPQSPDKVGRFLFDEGRSGGGAPTPEKYVWSGSDEFYVSFWFKVSENWQGHDSGVNKILYLTEGGSGDPLFFLARGSDSDTLTFEIMHQDGGFSTHDKTQNFYRWDGGLLYENEVSPSQSDVELVRGEWRQIEVLIRMNSDDAADGEIHAWIDGTKTMQYTSAEFSGSGNPIENIRWQPIWGGSGDVVEENMYQYIDHLYVSGKQ